MLWNLVRADVMRRLADHAPTVAFEERVMIAEHAAREVQELLEAIRSTDPSRAE